MGLSPDGGRNGKRASRMVRLVATLAGLVALNEAQAVEPKPDPAGAPQVKPLAAKESSAQPSPVKPMPIKPVPVKPRARGPFARMPTKHAGVLVPFANAPYPFHDGMIPEQNKPFFETDADGKFHASPRGGKYREKTYSDNSSLLFIPTTFDPNKPNAAIVLFFHGNLANLAYVRDHQGVPRQLAASGLNAVLVAPQLAINALDSSPGHFYDPGFLAKYLDEAETHLAEQSGRAKDVFAKLPVIVVAYSGGYLATAFSLAYKAEDSRIKGVILLDALFGEAGKIEDWVARTNGRSFFVSTFTDSSRAQNSELVHALSAQGIQARTKLSPVIAPGDVIVQGPDKVPHIEFVTNAWTKDPLRDVLKRVRLAPKPVESPAPVSPPPYER